MEHGGQEEVTWSDGGVGGKEERTEGRKGLPSGA